jgi:uncharacterized iron-regulated membrane protein
MSAWQQWVHRPHKLWLRRALFQVHLWVGIGIGLYILLISVSGSAVVYRRELTRKFARKPIAVTVHGPRLSRQKIEEDARRLYPGYQVRSVYQARRLEIPISVTLENGGDWLARSFDPYTGADLGDPVSQPEHILNWFVDFHDNLLAGRTGRVVNGVGSILVTILALTGTFIWWPGTKNWRRSTTINWRASFARFNFDMHSALGFWCSLFVLLWGISGIYFSFPDLFSFFLSDRGTLWLSRLHFGRFGWFAEAVWTILGLVPAVLFVTGVLMWWQRVLRKGIRQPS